jgi:transaldolase
MAGISFETNELKDLAESAFDRGANEIHLQTWGQETDQMLDIGRELARIDSRVMVKVPITEAGVQCASKLVAEGASVTLTAVHSASQALIAAALGVKYAAPYLGRMNDGGLNGLDEINSMQQIVTRLDSPLRLLVASIRQISDLVVLAEAGLKTFTLLPKLIDDLLENELTNLAADSFQQTVDGDLD